VFVLFLRFYGRADGTSIRASAAAYASVCVDNVLRITRRNSGDGTIFSACSAHNASIGNFVSHSFLPPFFLIIMRLKNFQRLYYITI
jgi:hypothetical protein